MAFGGMGGFPGGPRNTMGAISRANLGRSGMRAAGQAPAGGAFGASLQRLSNPMNQQRMMRGMPFRPVSRNGSR